MSRLDGDVNVVRVVVAIDGVLADQGAYEIQRLDGQIEQAPGVVFEATLFLSQDPPPKSDMKHPAAKFNADRLPKGSDGRSRARNLFALGSSRS